MSLKEQTIDLVHAVQALPYAWPVPPDAASARASRQGSCASKHALLAEELQAIGVTSLPLLVVGKLVPEALRTAPDCAPGAELVEVHECLTVLTPWAGPLLVDVTWDPALAAHGLAATLPWDGESDMKLALTSDGAGWSVPRERIRSEKEALRARLYSQGARAVRDATLAAMSMHFARFRATAKPPAELGLARRATAADAPAILAMMAELTRFESIPWTPEEGEAPLRALMADDRLGFVGMLDGEPGASGYFIVTWGFDLEWQGRDAYLTEIWLAEGARGLGFGARAMDEIESIARSYKARALHLMVRPENTRAIALYRRSGYASPPRTFMTKVLSDERPRRLHDF